MRSRHLRLDAIRGGEGPDLLVLLHGLGATREVWTPLRGRIARAWPGRWLAPDLPGHGQSPWLDDYAPARQASAVAELIREARANGRLVVLGHSLGAVVALELAGDRSGLRPDRVLGLGLKTRWTEDELAASRRRASTPARCFGDQGSAVAMYLKVSGLHGLVAPDDPIALAGVRKAEVGWRLAMDVRANGVGAPPMAELCAAAVAPFSLACGEHDPMADLRDLQRWDPGVCVLEGLGHNAMVESPAAVWRWVAEQLEPRECS